METRQILIANTKTQQRHSIQSAATTLGELKAQLLEQGIDYSGMTFTEGISKTQLLTDDTQLPTQVMYKGAPTNNLVMLLTNPNKQIASGAYPTNRKEFSVYIRKNNLGGKIKQKFGDNWTRVSTDNLLKFFAVQEKNIKNTATNTEENKQKLEEVREELVVNKVSESAVKETPKAITLPDIKTAPHAQTVEWFYTGVKNMVADHLLIAEDVVVIANLTTELAAHLLENKLAITDEDIDDMLLSLL